MKTITLQELSGRLATQPDLALIDVRSGGSISLKRQVRIGAGLLGLTGVLSGCFVHPAFCGLSAFVGSGLIFAGITDRCGTDLLPATAPWNKRRPA